MPSRPADYPIRIACLYQVLYIVTYAVPVGPVSISASFADQLRAALDDAVLSADPFAVDS